MAMERNAFVTLGFVPRERFSLAKRALSAVLRHTDMPFKLVVVDCHTPRRYWAEIERVLARRCNAGHCDVEVIHSDRYLLPGESRNLVLARATGDYVCFLEND